MKDRKKSVVYAFVSVILLSLALRFLYLNLASSLPTFQSPGMDSETYRSWAEAIIKGTQLNEPYFRAPLYPYLIALLGRLFGGDTFYPIRIFQIIFSALSAGMLVILGRRWFSLKTGWIAGLLWAVYGLSIYFDNEGLIESLYTSLFILLLFFLDKYRLALKIGFAILSAIVLGILTSLRSNALLWWIVLLSAIWRTVTDQNQETIQHNKKALIPIFVTLIVMVLIVLPILLHNLRTGGGFVISTQGGINLYLGNNPTASGAYAVDPDYGNDWTREQIAYRAGRQSGKILSDGEISSYYANKALQFWLTKPLKAMALTGRKIFLLINSSEISNNRILLPFLHEVHPLFAYLVLLSFPITMLLGLPGLFRLWRVNRSFQWAIIFTIVHLIGILPFFVTARYRFPAMPVFVLSAASIVKYMPLYLQKWRNNEPKLAIKGVLWILFAIIVLFPNPITYNPHEKAIWQFHQGNALLRMERWEQAKSYFYEALAEDLAYKNAHLNIGVCYLHQGEIDSARSHFLKELDNSPTHAPALNNLGVLAEQEHNAPQALFYYAAAYRSDPAHTDSRLNLARLHNIMGIQAAYEGRKKEAHEHLKSSKIIAPESNAYAVTYAMLLMDEQNYGEAREIIDRVLNRAPAYKPAQKAKALLERLLESPDSTSVVK